jgi:hypothetical protein
MTNNGDSSSRVLVTGGKNRNRGNKNDPLRNILGQFVKQNGDNNKNQTSCGWINIRDFDKVPDEEKFKRVKAVHAWYERFVHGIPKDLVKDLTEDSSAKLVAWEVQNVVAQLKNVYSRAEEYLKTSETVRNQLASMNPTPVLRDGETDIPFAENNPRIEQLFRIDKLKYANLNLLSILSGINNEKLHNYAERWVQSNPNYRTQKVTPNFVGLDYDPWYDVFFAHYGYEGFVSPPIVSVQFKLSPRNGNINEKEDCNGYPYQKVLNEARHLITIVYPISEGDNLWSLLKPRPVTLRRAKTYSSINDPLVHSRTYRGGNKKKK